MRMDAGAGWSLPHAFRAGAMGARARAGARPRGARPRGGRGRPGPAPRPCLVVVRPWGRLQPQGVASSQTWGWACSLTLPLRGAAGIRVSGARAPVLTWPCVPWT